MIENWTMKDVWKNNLTDEMFDFIEKEFNISKDEILSNNSFDFYHNLLYDILDIEVLEVPDDANERISERGRIAADIVTYMTARPIHNKKGEIIGEVPRINKNK